MNDGIDALIEVCADCLACESLAFGHGGANPRSEAELLVLGFLENHPLEENTRELLDDLLQDRIVRRVPSAYLTGEAWFADRWFAVRPGVMIPRSPIQELIRCDFRPWLRRTPETVLDMCCGTGCLGIATALRFPEARVTLADIDEAALANARTNIERFHLGGRVEARLSDLFDGLDHEEFDLVLANPPYVPESEFLALPPEYAHEPRHGLEAGTDGLDCWRRLLAGIGSWLRMDGLLVGESGNASSALETAFPDLPFLWPELTRAERLSDGGFGVFVLDGAALTCQPEGDSRYFRQT
ncbi:MAG: 50S ribosomal protein L3 N(5)-glutamine methyltransferase [bacterium]|nr:50S ribosomal protein L3 N(5)-glutamine methyltransferase [bacterium]MDE0238975.1 50S ribosomal protein L3 N(5)-glutamine methyltransferase [bacterium]